MAATFNYQTTFRLDRAHFNECFHESVAGKEVRLPYLKALVLIVIGMMLVLFSTFDKYLTSFVVGLGIVEGLSVRYQQAWWVTRQMLSRAANSEVKLTIDESGIRSQNFLADHHIQWNEITGLETTANGVLICTDKQRHYLSNQCLSEQAKQYMLSQINL